VPTNRGAQAAELERLERELASPALSSKPARRLLAIERRRVVIALGAPAAAT
jgi:hypothetical protein